MWGGGGGASRSIWHKKSSDNVLFNLFYFFSPQLILQKSMEWFLSKKTIIFQGSNGGGTFSRGSNFFQGCPIAFSL